MQTGLFHYRKLFKRKQVLKKYYWVLELLHKLFNKVLNVQGSDTTEVQ